MIDHRPHSGSGQDGQPIAAARGRRDQRNDGPIRLPFGRNSRVGDQGIRMLDLPIRNMNSRMIF